jgi:phosphoribosylaminoimidazolecarboxamide formyltransferase/IMP cyclohydrolase
VRIRRALLSVSDKTGLVELGQELTAHGVEILSTGGSARVLAQARVPVREVADVTGFPEIMDGRVKTLHPKIHGGLLGRSGVDDEVMAQQGIVPIDLLVVNLYPFARTLLQPGVRREEIIENIDVGGPAMLRAAAKNHERVTVVADPADYPRLIAAIAQGGPSQELRTQLAAKAFAHTAAYDALIARYLAAAGDAAEGFPAILNLVYEKAQELRYGENPHQRAALYRDPLKPGGIAQASFLQGKELSYNNLADADAALACVSLLPSPACVIVKHANPCGAAVGTTPLEAYTLAHRTDPTSAFGGIIAFNCPLDAATAQAILARQFVEVLLAPEVSPDARAALAAKPAVRVLTVRSGGSAAEELRSISGGLLLQTRDTAPLEADKLKIVTRRQPSQSELADLRFAFAVCQMVKSNAIVYARESATLGIGAGQMSRVYSARIAAMKAGDEKLTLTDAVMASDAFFPFRDGIDAAAAHGIRAVIQPGGAKRDAEVIEAADAHGMAMVFTAIRHFRH